MDQGWAAVIGAGIGIISAAVGVLGGYLEGRAQARGTVDGVILQIDGQRADALWQAEVDACALFIDRCNHAMLKLSQLRAIADYNARATIYCGNFVNCKTNACCEKLGCGYVCRWHRRIKPGTLVKP